MFASREVAGDSQKVTLESSSFRIELIHLSRAYRVKNHHKNLLRKLFSRRNGSSHVHEEPIDGPLMLIVKLQKGMFVSFPKTLSKLGIGI